METFRLPLRDAHQIWIHKSLEELAIWIGTKWCKRSIRLLGLRDPCGILQIRFCWRTSCSPYYLINLNLLTSLKESSTSALLRSVFFQWIVWVAWTSHHEHRRWLNHQDHCCGWSVCFLADVGTRFGFHSASSLIRTIRFAQSTALNTIHRNGENCRHPLKFESLWMLFSQ